MIADFHMHSYFSTDSHADPRDMAEAAIARGLKTICFTEHHDIDAPDPEEFVVSTADYFDAMRKVREEYAGRLDIRIGVELGMMATTGEKTSAYAAAWPFDFVIGSVHILDGKDPYYREDFADYSDAALFRRYFEEVRDSLRVTTGIHSLGHLDYIVRYGRNGAEEYSYEANREIIDEILREIIGRGIALEVNGGGYRAGLDFPNPHPDILRRYRELGGERITVGSDAHRPENIGDGFERIRKLLLDCGFEKYYVYKNGAVDEVLFL